MLMIMSMIIYVIHIFKLEDSTNVVFDLKGLVRIFI